MTTLAVRHATVYSYARPVRFGDHRLMFRPRDSHDLRLLDTALDLSPRAEVRWLHDVFSNSIAVASFAEPAETLSFESRITVEHFGLHEPDFPLEPYAQTYPFSYSAEEVPDLGRTIERHYPDPERRVDGWAKAVLERLSGQGGGAVDTQELLVEINQAIGRAFDYERRYALGTRSPAETLAQGAGSCRDLALFMMEAVRSLGLAARFVTGYLFDPALDRQGTRRAGGGGRLPAVPGDSAIRGAGDTHAWVQVYLPGAGWMEFDPTNALVGGARLIRVAVARDPSQAVPLQGTYFGAPEDFLEMRVEVEVSRLDAPDAATAQAAPPG